MEKALRLASQVFGAVGDRTCASGLVRIIGHRTRARRMPDVSPDDRFGASKRGPPGPFIGGAGVPARVT